MPGLAGFGGATDWSSTFAGLANQYLNDIESKANYLDQKRETAQSATDQSKFDQFNAGQLSGQELLAYIRKRIAETKYDPSQQETWKKALLQYTASIADNAAEAQYANGGSVGDLIGYYQDKLKGLAKNNPEYQSTQKRIHDLQVQSVQQDFSTGSEKIQAQIALGQATNADLLAFQRQSLANAPKDPALRQSITTAIDSTRAAVQQDQFNASWAQVQVQLQAGTITAAEAGRTQLDLLTNSGLQNTSPSTYYSMLEDTMKMINTPDDKAYLAQIDYQLLSQQITPLEAAQMYYAEADKWQILDPTTAYNIRTTAWHALHPGNTTPLPNPGALNGTYGPGGNTGTANVTPYSGPPGSFKWISQLDGTQFADINCAAASTAMLAHVLGVNGLSGGDIRYLSHDTSGGITLDQDAAVLAQLGVKGLRSTYSNPINFDQFKHRIATGAPAVLSGIYGNVAANLRVSPTLTGTHQMMIGEYDPKKHAFLVFDPAVSQRTHPGYKGEWWPEEQVRQFGWGPSLNGDVRYGQALFAPAGTIKPGQNPSVKYRFVSVDTPPQRPGTPASYVGLTNPGNVGEAPGIHPTVTTGGNPSATSLTDPNPAAQGPAGQTRPSTVEEAQALVDANKARLDTISQLTDAYAKGDTSIDIGGEHYALDQATVTALNQEALHKMDWDIALTNSMGETGAASTLRDQRSAFVTLVKTANTVPQELLWGTLMRDANHDLALADLETDPNKAAGYINKITDRIKAFQKAQVAANTVTVRPSDYGPQTAAEAAGLLTPGNIDLNNRPVAKNPDGSISTVLSFSREQDGQEVLVPMIVDGKKLTEDQAWAHYLQTGENLGKFDTPASADAYAQSLHDQQARVYAPGATPPAGTSAELSGTDVPGTTQDLQGQIDATLAVLNIASNTSLTPADKAGQINELWAATGFPGKEMPKPVQGDLSGANVIATIANATTGIGMLEAGTGMKIMANGTVTVVPTVTRGDPNNPGGFIPVPDTSSFGTAASPVDPLTLPTVLVSGPSGPEQIPAVPSTVQVGSYYQYTGNQTDASAAGFNWVNKHQLTAADFNAPDAKSKIDAMIANGKIKEVPATVTVMQMPPTVQQTSLTQLPDVQIGKRVVPGTMYAQDPGTLGWSAVTHGFLPWQEGSQPTGRPGIVAFDPENNGPAYIYKQTDEIPSPYAGDMSPKAIQSAVNAGHIVLPQIRVRNDDPAATPVDAPVGYSPYDPVNSAWADTARQMASQVPTNLPGPPDPNRAMDIWNAATGNTPAPTMQQAVSTPFGQFTPGTQLQSPTAPPPPVAHLAAQYGLNVSDGHDLHPPQQQQYTPPAPAATKYNDPNRGAAINPLPRIGQTPAKSSQPSKDSYYKPPPPQKVNNTPVVHKTPGGVGVV